MFCTGCGTRNGIDANFCKQCGIKLEKSVHPNLPEEAFNTNATGAEEFHENLIEAYKLNASGNHKEAIAVCVAVLETHPDSTDAHSLLSSLYEKSGDRELAIKERERVLELNPGSIADREKLDELRDGGAKGPLPKVISNHRPPSVTISDNSTFQFAAVAIVMLIVFGVGAFAIWKSKTPTQTKPSDTNVSQQSPASPLQRSQGDQPRFAQTTGGTPVGSEWTSSAPPGWYFHGNASAGANQPANDNRVRRNNPVSQSRDIDPAPINMTNEIRADRTASRAAPAPDRGATVHLPDSASSPDSGQNSSNPQSNTVKAAPMNRIEISVNPTTPDKTTVNSGNKSANENSGKAFDAQNTLKTARDLYNRGQFRQAISEFNRSLDGSGDSAADIHQSLAFCFQRLGDRENAVAHYNAAITGFKGMIAAGKNTEIASRAIRTCESGIKVNQ